MSKQGKKKKRPSEYLNVPPDPSANIAPGDRCVYCGKALSPEFGQLFVTARTRSFPVCSEECRELADEYVLADRKKKKFLYLILFLCSIAILIGSVLHDPSLLIYPAIGLAGLGMILFPYPITSFETFFACPMRRVVLICRVLGAALILLGIFFFVAIRIAG